MRVRIEQMKPLPRPCPRFLPDSSSSAFTWGACNPKTRIALGLNRTLPTAYPLSFRYTSSVCGLEQKISLIVSARKNKKFGQRRPRSGLGFSIRTQIRECWKVCAHGPFVS